MSSVQSEHERISSLPAQNLLIIAPPGCGKTELLAMRAAVITDKLKPNQRILALTFSNRAKQNLSQRISEMLGAARARRHVTIQNFHGLATAVIRAHGKTLGIDPNFVMPGKRTLANAIKPYTDGLSFGAAAKVRGEIESALQSSKQTLATDAQVLESLSSTNCEPAIEIETERQAQNILHYDDVLRHGQRLLNVPEIANLYQHHYGAAIVDEFQDLSPQQLDIAIVATSGYLTFAGDPLQGIYSWAGARPVEVEQKLRELCGEPELLTTSFRSSPAVLKAVNAVAASFGSPELNSFDAQRWHEGGIASALTFSSGMEEASWIAQTTKQILEKFPAATVGVIARAGWRRKLVDTAFVDGDVPHVQWDLTVDDASVVKSIKEAVKTLPKNATISQLRDAIIESLPPEDFELHNDLIDALEHLEGLAEGSDRAEDAARRLKVRDPNTAVTPGAHLLNAHTGKGQQFDWVFIPGFEGFHLPSNQAETDAELLEERRVLLVMLSRARHAITLSRASSLTSKKGKPYSPDVSMFWKLAANACSATKEKVEQHIASAAKI